MKIAITGATGFIGRILVSRLKELHYQLVLFGRDKGITSSIFPDQLVYDYDNLEENLRNVDILIHLATKNNSEKSTIDEYKKANVELTKLLAQSCKINNVKLFINFSTDKIFHIKNKDNYSRTKIESISILNEYDSINIIHFILPYVYECGRYRGKLHFLNAFPKFIRSNVFFLLCSIRRTVDVQLVCDHTISVITAESLAPGNVFVSDCQHSNPIYHGVKRFVDLAFATSVTFVLWPVLLSAWIAVKISSRGPAIFKQTRVGLHGSQFNCYKFRTMLVGTKQAASHEVGQAAITAVGKVLRRTKIDELPQIINIFRNEMSVVGPRPCLPTQTDLITARKNLGVYFAKPGITGLAQIKGIDMSTPNRLAVVDAEYIAKRTLMLDAWLICSTLLGRGQGDAASG
jgi:lipopolysaccharide/colanic/teichoic acid biosynthesis glycosyltransferase